MGRSGAAGNAASENHVLPVMQLSTGMLGSAFAIVTLAVSSTACVDVSTERSGKDSKVDVRTAAGDISVNSRVDPRDTGLPVYPGAVQASNDDDHHDSGNVNIVTSWFGVKVVAATFDTSDPPETVIDFYRGQMRRTFGAVTECRGEVDFKGTTRQPVCREKASSADMQLVTGPEERQRIVSVKPHGNGSEFSLVYVQTRGDN